MQGRLRSRLERSISEARAIKESLLALTGGGEEQAAESNLPSDPVEFNRAIGLPVHPLTNEPHELFPYQVEILNDPQKDVVIAKSNKIGVTEAVLRDMVFRGTVGDCIGYQMMLGAQSLELAIENMSRVQAIFRRSDILSGFIDLKERPPNRKRLYLRNGTMYFTMPTAAAAVRGWSRLKYAFLDEAAHYGFLDDEEFLAATMSRLSNTEGYMRTVSTPKGQRGFFYRSYVQATSGKSNTKEYTLPYYLALGKLISQDFIDEAKVRLGPLFPQEYECQFLSSQSAAVPAGLIEQNEFDYEPDNLDECDEGEVEEGRGE